MIMHGLLVFANMLVVLKRKAPPQVDESRSVSLMCSSCRLIWVVGISVAILWNSSSHLCVASAPPPSIIKRFQAHKSCCLHKLV